ncbi:hypothetical protein D3C72_2516910 [compost metagenome]
MPYSPQIDSSSFLSSIARAIALRTLTLLKGSTLSLNARSSLVVDWPAVTVKSGLSLN